MTRAAELSRIVPTGVGVSSRERRRVAPDAITCPFDAAEK